MAEFQNGSWKEALCARDLLRKCWRGGGGGGVVVVVDEGSRFRAARTLS